MAEDLVDLAIAGPMVGTSSAVGIQYRVGVTAAVNNLPQGRLLGKKVRITLYDDNCSKQIALRVAQEIVEKDPVVVIGHSCSGATIAAAPIYAQERILQITPASSNPRITEMGIPTVFRMIGRDDIQGQVAAERFIKEYGNQRIGILSFPGEYSRNLADTFQETMENAGITPVSRIVGESSSASYVEVIDEFTRQNIDVLYLVGGGLDGGVFVRQKHQLQAPFKIIGTDTLVSTVFKQAAGEAAEGIPYTFPPEAALLATADSAVKAITEMGQEPVGYTLLAYAAAEVWIQGVKKARSFDSVTVAEAIRNNPVDTILGRVQFDEKGDIITPYKPFSWYVWDKGKRILEE